MKGVKWVLGVVLAGTITLGPANFLMHHMGEVDMKHLTAFQYWIQFLIVPSLAFGLFAFLACVFVPIQKKYAGVVVVVISFLFIVSGAYQHYLDDGFVHRDYVIRYSGFAFSLSIGFALSYKLFRQNRWT